MLGLGLHVLSPSYSKRRVVAAAMFGSGIVLVFLCMMPITASVLKTGLEVGLGAASIPTEVEGDRPRAIVVLAGDIVGNRRAAGLLAGPQPGPLSMGRVRAALALQKRTHLPIAITGRNSVDNTVVSDMMRSVLIEEYGVLPDMVPEQWIDHEAHDTWENADKISAIMQKAGIFSVYLVTDGWHMRRALLAFRHTGLHVIAAPVSLTSPAHPILSDFSPRATAWLETFYAVHEWLGCAYYAIRD